MEIYRIFIVVQFCEEITNLSHHWDKSQLFKTKYLVCSKNNPLLVYSQLVKAIKNHNIYFI